MENIINYIKNNYLSLCIGLFFYLLFVYYNTSGSQLCDCETTEKYKPESNARGSINRFYHK